MKLPTREERLAILVQSLTNEPDFPAFSQHVQAILTAVEGGEVPVRELTNLIIRDYSLTLNLLRRANAYNYSGRQILSVAHAVIMLGTEAVRHIAASQLIFEHFHGKPAGVRELMMLSMLSANHVREVAARLPEVKPEEAFLCGMVRNLGEVLIAYYRPREYARILKLVEKSKRPLSNASLEVLRFSFEDLGEAIVWYWGMPERVAQCQRATPPDRAAPKSPENLLLAAVSLGHLMTTAVYRMEPAVGAVRLKACLQDHDRWLPLGKKDLDEILAKAIIGTQESFDGVGVRINELRLQAQTQSVLESLYEADPQEAGEAAQSPPDVAADTLERLTKEVAAVESRADCNLNTLILMALDAIQRGAGFERVIFAFVDQERTHIEGRIGVGDEVDCLLKKFKFRMSMTGGPVSVILLTKHSVLVDSERAESHPIGRLFGCGYFGLYPVVLADQVVGCIYMESRNSRPSLKSSEMQFFEQLRDSLVSAILRLRRGN